MKRSRAALGHLGIAAVLLLSAGGWSSREAFAWSFSPDGRFQETMVLTKVHFKPAFEIYVGSRGNPRGYKVARIFCGVTFVPKIGWDDPHHLQISYLVVSRVDSTRSAVDIDGEHIIVTLDDKPSGPW